MFRSLFPPSIARRSLSGSPPSQGRAIEERPRLRVRVGARGLIHAVAGINAAGRSLLSGFVTGGRAT